VTTCAECLQEISTARLADVRPGTAVAYHAASCPSCAGVLEDIRFAEWQLATSLNELQPQSSTQSLIQGALEGSERLRRRRLARWMRGGLAAAACGVCFVFMEMRTETDPENDVITETIRLKCMTATQASDLATMYLRSSVSRIFVSDELRTITLRARSDEYAAARMAIDQFEAAPSCVSPPPSADADVIVTPGQEKADPSSAPRQDDR